MNFKLRNGHKKAAYLMGMWSFLVGYGKITFINPHFKYIWDARGIYVWYMTVTNLADISCSYAAGITYP